MARGDVHLIHFTFERPDGSTETMPKFVILLRGGGAAWTEAYVPFVIASTLKPPGRAIQGYEVAMGEDEGFSHDTVVECRWVHTLPKARFTEHTKKHYSLDAASMAKVSKALLVGLQFGPPPAS